jgi:hypothetical protein
VDASSTRNALALVLADGEDKRTWDISKDKRITSQIADAIMSTAAPLEFALC